MAQTFIDLYRERQQQEKKQLFKFVLWVFVETTTGIVQENASLFREGSLKMWQWLKLPMLIGLLIVLPFLSLELANRRSYAESFPFTLFGILWLLPVAFTSVLRIVVQTRSASRQILVKPIPSLLRMLLLFVIALIFAAILADQMPCFLGFPQCD